MPFRIVVLLLMLATDAFLDSCDVIYSHKFSTKVKTFLQSVVMSFTVVALFRSYSDISTPKMKVG